jgi:hypothetical protein
MLVRSSKALRARPIALFAAALDAAVQGWSMFKNPITPSLEITFADLIRTDFHGASLPKGIVAPAVVQLFDPVSGHEKLYVNQAKSANSVKCTSADEFVPQIVYGQYLYSSVSTAVWATSLFTPAPLIADVGDGVAFNSEFLVFGEYLA